MKLLASFIIGACLTGLIFAHLRLNRQEAIMDIEMNLLEEETACNDEIDLMDYHLCVFKAFQKSNEKLKLIGEAR